MRNRRNRPFVGGLVLAAWLSVSVVAPQAVAWQPDVTATDEVDSPGAGGDASDDASPAGESNETVTPNELAEQGPGDENSAVPPNVKPARFNQVEPGKTSLAELKKVWGEPADVVTNGQSRVLVYKMEPFNRVEATVAGGVVTSVVVHLEKTLPPEHISKLLGLDDLVAVPIADQFGQLLGQVFPERGVLFSFVPDTPDPHVAQILLEPIGAEAFIARAQHDFDHEYGRDLMDVNYAIKLDPQAARAHWLKAKLLAATGRYEEALTSASEAVRLEPATTQYRLTVAHLLGETGQPEQAREETKQAIFGKNVAPEVKASALCQLGDLVAIGPDHDYKQAITHHLEAIKLATPLATDRRFAVRRLAKRVLIDAHLAVASDIALGDWRRKAEVVPKWLLRGGAFAQEMIANDHGDAGLMLLVHRKSLSVYAELQGAIDPTVAAGGAIEEGRTLIAGASDRMYKNQIEWELGMALLDALRVEHARGKHGQALRYADSAMALLDRSAGQRQSTPRDTYTLGRGSFLIGSIHAVQKHDHREAVGWYEKAIPLLSQPLLVATQSGRGRHGERLVSIGLSYWEAGRKDEGRQLTEQGVQFIEQAVEGGTLKWSTLAVPYGNLAAMHRQLGNQREAEDFARMATRLQEADQATKRR